VRPRPYPDTRLMRPPTLPRPTARYPEPIYQPKKNLLLGTATIVDTDSCYLVLAVLGILVAVLEATLIPK